MTLGHGPVLHQVCLPGKVQAKDKLKKVSNEIDSSSVVTCYSSECYSPDLKPPPDTHRLTLSSSLGFLEMDISGRDRFMEQFIQ